MKKLLSFIIAATLVFGVVPNAFAADNDSVGNENNGSEQSVTYDDCDEFVLNFAYENPQTVDEYEFTPLFVSIVAAANAGKVSIVGDFNPADILLDIDGDNEADVEFSTTPPNELALAMSANVYVTLKFDEGSKSFSVTEKDVKAITEGSSNSLPLIDPEDYDYEVPFYSTSTFIAKPNVTIKSKTIDVSKKEYVIPADEYAAFMDFMYAAMENEKIFETSDIFAYLSGNMYLFDLDGDNIPDIYVKGLYYLMPTSLAEDIEYERPPIKVGRIPITLTQSATVESGLSKEDYENMPLYGNESDILVFDQITFKLGANNNKYTVDLSKAPFSAKNVPDLWEMEDFAFINESTRDYVKLDDFMYIAAMSGIIDYESDPKNEGLIYFDLDKDGNNDISLKYTYPDNGSNSNTDDETTPTCDIKITKLDSTKIKNSYTVSLNPLFEREFKGHMEVKWGSADAEEYFYYSEKIGPMYPFNDVTFIFSSGGGGGGGNKDRLYQIHFETNGGAKIPPKSYSPDSIIDPSEYTPEKENDKFLGWYHDSAFTRPANEKFRLESDVTLYAKWQSDEDKPNVPPVIPEDPDKLPFSDVGTGDWFYKDVKEMYEKGLMSGMGNGKFEPNISTERAMVVSIIYRLEGSPAVEYKPLYSDVKEGEWYTDAIIWTSEQGISSGYPEGDFKPNQIVSRQELARFIYMYACYKGSGFKGLWNFKLDFDDADKVGSWAKESVQWCVMNGLITGVGNNLLAPRDISTRAQLAAIFNRFSKLDLTPAVAEEEPAEEQPDEEKPAEETPAAETPSEEAPAEETPAAETPAEETPAEEVTAG